jgi:hypothetical protein
MYVRSASSDEQGKVASDYVKDYYVHNTYMYSN